ncbi:MAG: carotenoid 1,2-hydratase [Bdellovibrio bacteriovorus]
MRAGGPRFDLRVPAGGYVWWYLDGLSDDGRYGITLIAFVGSVFSPYYAWGRRRGRADPTNHCALNVALYATGRAGPRRWTCTERGRVALGQGLERLAIGPSALTWEGDRLNVEIDERAAPLPYRVRGRVRMHPLAITGRDFLLDGLPGSGGRYGGRHRWWPIAPRARLEVQMEVPRLAWRGAGYLDMNAGAEPLERGFHSWDWSRAGQEGASLILYDTRARDGSARSLALRIDDQGRVEDFQAPDPAPLPRTAIWRIPRATRSDPGTVAQVAQTLEDTPFYARSVVGSTLRGRPVVAVHESLSLERFASPWVQVLLPFRMPRVTWSRH